MELRADGSGAGEQLFLREEGEGQRTGSCRVRTGGGCADELFRLLGQNQRSADIHW